MSAVEDKDIDQEVLSILGEVSLKTVMVIYLVGEAFEDTNNDFLKRVELRISFLIEKNLIKVDGNLSKWRLSEIRKMV